jgi:hypothetical protein
MQNPKQQGVARICIGGREKINKKIFSDGCDGRPNGTSSCNGTVNVRVGPQESEHNFVSSDLIRICSGDEKTALWNPIDLIFTSHKDANDSL